MPIETVLTGNLGDRGPIVLRTFGIGGVVDSPAANHGSDPRGYRWTVPAAVVAGDAYKLIRSGVESGGGEVDDGYVEIAVAATIDASKILAGYEIAGVVGTMTLAAPSQVLAGVHNGPDTGTLEIVTGIVPGIPGVDSPELSVACELVLHDASSTQSGAARLDAAAVDGEGAAASVFRYRRTPAGTGLPAADYCDGIVTPREWFELGVGGPVEGSDSYRLDQVRWVFDDVAQAKASRQTVEVAVADLRSALASLSATS